MLLSGASGLSFDRRGPRDLPTALALEPREAPGTQFSDDAAPYVLFSEIARRKLEASGPRAGRRTLPHLAHACCRSAACRSAGRAAATACARFDDGAAVSARGWAQAGELIRREGVWRAQQLADDAALREAMRGSFAEARAGFGLWLAGAGAVAQRARHRHDIWRAVLAGAADLAMAAGQGGQRLYISPVARIGDRAPARSLAASSWSDAQFLSLIWRDL